MPEPSDLKTGLIAPRLTDLGLATDRPLAIIDVDEVLGLFIKGFEGFVSQRGVEMRIERFTIFQSLYRPGETQHLDVTEGRALLDDFFRTGSGQMEPAPGAMEALARIGAHAQTIILSNAPAAAEAHRADWLKRHGADHPLLLNTGPKGPIVAGLTAQTSGRSAFVDDLISNLDSVAEHSPATARFQHVADVRLRALAPTNPQAHRRIDDWDELGEAIIEAIAAA